MRNDFWRTKLNAKSFTLIFNPLSPAAVLTLKTAGILIELKPLKFATCNHCLKEVPVEFTSDKKPYIFCEDGIASLNPDTLKRWRIDQQKIIEFLRSVLGLTEQSDHSERCIQYLGRMPSPNGGTPLWWINTNGCDETLIYAKHYLETRSPNYPGLILVDNPLGLATVWPRKHQSALLDDILDIKNGNLTINLDILNQSVPSIKKTKGKPGAPGKNTLDPLDTFHRRIQQGQALKTSCKAEATAIAAFEEVKFGGDKARQWETIRNAISESYIEWKRLGFPDTYTKSHNS